jgi:hypothetical protein
MACVYLFANYFFYSVSSHQPVHQKHTNIQPSTINGAYCLRLPHVMSLC